MEMQSEVGFIALLRGAPCATRKSAELQKRGRTPCTWLLNGDNFNHSTRKLECGQPMHKPSFKLIVYETTGCRVLEFLNGGDHTLTDGDHFARTFSGSCGGPLRNRSTDG
jgi:hypothetical protein